MKHILILVGLTVALSFAGRAQQNPQYSLFMFNKQAINPAYVGSRGSFSINADYRTQWVATEGNPETFNIGVHTPLGKGALIPRLAAGLMYSHESLGAQERNNIAAQIAYRTPVGEETILSFGLEGSMYNISYNASNLRAEDANDATIAMLGENNMQINFSGGVYLYHDRYYAGLSAVSLANPNNSNMDQPTAEITFRRHYYAMAGYLQPVNDWLKLRANVINKYVYIQETGESPNTADINLSAIFADRFLVGASYRTDKTAIAMAQFQINSYLNLAYAYDFKTSQYSRLAGASHEVFLGIDLGGNTRSLTSPRFVTYF